METKDMTITQVVDIGGCREKAAIYRGMAAAVLDNVSKQVCLSHCRWIGFCIYKLNRPKSVLFLCVLQFREGNLSFQQ